MNKINKKKPIKKPPKEKQQKKEDSLRNKNGLSFLTEKFLNLVHGSKDGQVDLNQAV